MNKKHDDAENLGSLVEAELAAVKTYRQALEKVSGKEAVGPELRRLEAEHEDAVSVLREHLADSDADAPGDAGLWGEWAKAIGGAAAVLGDRAAIKALKNGEEHGVDSYENALRNEKLDPGIRHLIRSRLLPRSKAHIPVLERLLEIA